MRYSASTSGAFIWSNRTHCSFGERLLAVFHDEYNFLHTAPEKFDWEWLFCVNLTQQWSYGELFEQVRSSFTVSTIFLSSYGLHSFLPFKRLLKINRSYFSNALKREIIRISGSLQKESQSHAKPSIHTVFAEINAHPEISPHQKQWFSKGGLHKTDGFHGWFFKGGSTWNRLVFDGGFFKGGSTWNRWGVMGDFAKLNHKANFVCKFRHAHFFSLQIWRISYVDRHGQAECLLYSPSVEASGEIDRTTPTMPANDPRRI